jgi:hypothetical protein
VRARFSGRIAGFGSDNVRLSTDSAKACLLRWRFLQKKETIVQSAIDRGPAGTGRRILSSLGLSACTLGALLVAGMATAADGKLSEAQARYQQDRAACVSGQSHQDRATCLREAGAALQEAKRGRIGDGQTSYEQNQQIRCDRLTAGDREDCLRRMRGEGTVSGSVEGGGIYRELRTTVPAQ